MSNDTSVSFMQFFLAFCDRPKVDSENIQVSNLTKNMIEEYLAPTDTIKPHLKHICFRISMTQKS